MIFKVRMTLAAMVFSIGLAACTDDEKKAEETVTPAANQQPATPPEDAAGKEALKTVYFAFDDYTLNSDSQATLNKVAEFLKGNQAVVVQVEGHCDERGSIEYNLALGERRAQSVKNYLVQLGVDAARLPTISYGEEKPVEQGHDESAWSKNRRAEFVVSKP